MRERQDGPEFVPTISAPMYALSLLFIYDYLASTTTYGTLAHGFQERVYVYAGAGAGAGAHHTGGRPFAGVVVPGEGPVLATEDPHSGTEGLVPHPDYAARHTTSTVASCGAPLAYLSGGTW